MLWQGITLYTMHEGHKLSSCPAYVQRTVHRKCYITLRPVVVDLRPSVTIPSAISPNFLAPNFVQGSGSQAPSLIALLIKTLVPAEGFFSFSNWGEDIFFSSFSPGLFLNEIVSVRAQNSLAALNCEGLVSNNYFSNMFLNSQWIILISALNLCLYPGSCFALLFWELLACVIWCRFQIVCIWHLGRHFETVMFW